MKGWRWCLLAFLFLPELRLNPWQGDLPCSWPHPLGTDALGRGGLLRLLHASGRSLGFASAVTLSALGLGLLLALGKARLPGVRSAFRAAPPLLPLLAIAAWMDGLGWFSLGLLLTIFLAFQAEPPLRAKLGPICQSPAWSMHQLQGASFRHRVCHWAPWAMAQAAALAPSLWIAILWDEASLRLMGLGPAPTQDSFGLVLSEELPRLSTDPSPLGWASLATLLLLTASYGWRKP